MNIEYRTGYILYSCTLVSQIAYQLFSLLVVLPNVVTYYMFMITVFQCCQSDSVFAGIYAMVTVIIIIIIVSVYYSNYPVRDFETK